MDLSESSIHHINGFMCGERIHFSSALYFYLERFGDSYCLLVMTRSTSTNLPRITPNNRLVSTAKNRDRHAAGKASCLKWSVILNESLNFEIIPKTHFLNFQSISFFCSIHARSRLNARHQMLSYSLMFLSLRLLTSVIICLLHSATDSCNLCASLQSTKNMQTQIRSSSNVSSKPDTPALNAKPSKTSNWEPKRESGSTTKFPKSPFRRKDNRRARKKQQDYTIDPRES